MVVFIFPPEVRSKGNFTIRFFDQGGVEYNDKNVPINRRVLRQQ